MISLFQEPENCCGCGTCAEVCPKQAISMVADAYGFLYPQIDRKLCISCGKCKKVCAFQKENEAYTPLAVYALARKNADMLKLSSSGGAFSVFAEHFITEQGTVFGAALVREASTLVPRHCAATSEEELAPMRGSKYVQSSLGHTFVQVKQLLEAGKKVLFSGTPCQIAALKSFLKQDYDSLLTIDLICHGVPSAKMFQEYLKTEEKKTGGTITDFVFRAKESDYGENARAVFIDSAGNQQIQIIPRYESSYYDYFFQNSFLRDSCHNCSYAGKQHLADLTVGDFWGFENVYPEDSTMQNKVDPKKGLSLLIINTEKGRKYFNACSDEFYCLLSSFEKASQENPQLVHPSRPGDNREKILKIYRKKGYRGIDSAYWMNKKKVAFINWIKYHLHHDIPAPVRKAVKTLLHR